MDFQRCTRAGSGHPHGRDGRGRGIKGGVAWWGRDEGGGSSESESRLEGADRERKEVEDREGTEGVVGRGSREGVVGRGSREGVLLPFMKGVELRLVAEEVVLPSIESVEVEPMR